MLSLRERWSPSSTNSSAAAVEAGSVAPSRATAAWSGGSWPIWRTYSLDGIVSETVMTSPPWNAATTSSSSPAAKLLLNTFSTARCTSLPSTLSSLWSPSVSSSIFPVVDAAMAGRSETRGATSRSPSRMARRSALDMRFSQLQMVTRTETPERWLISGDRRARWVSSATSSFM